LTDIGIQISDGCNGASSNGRTQAFGACCGGSTPPAPDMSRGAKQKQVIKNQAPRANKIWNLEFATWLLPKVKEV
jgi:hypothetical protein